MAIRALLVEMTGLEPARLAAPDPKSGVSANFTTSRYESRKALKTTECLFVLY